MDGFLEQLKAYSGYLNSSRPTAVNLSWALNVQLETAEAHRQEGREAVLEALYEQAVEIH